MINELQDKQYLMNTDLTESKRKHKWNWVYDLLFLIVLIGAAFLRLQGSDWGELQHQHPDEGFLTSVTYDIGLVGAKNDTFPLPTTLSAPWRVNYAWEFPDCTQWGGYFDTSCSPLNPHNRGHAFYAYGTLPVFMTRYLAVWTDQMGNLKLFGRQLSAVMDLMAIALLYIISTRLYGKRVALLAATFSSLAVMQIQQSHFYTSDLFANFFIFLALYFAVEILTGKTTRITFDPLIPNEVQRTSTWEMLKKLLKERDLILSVLFGLAFGMAIASKLNAAPLALILPLAFFIKYFKRDRDHDHPEIFSQVLIFLIVGGLMALISFRIFQPYAFDGLGLNPQWLSNIREQRAQANANADLPWNLQWARRSHMYSFENLTVWGLGLPLGILAWAGFLWMGWRSLRGEWRKHILIWSWTAGYFIWQSIQYNPTMRYELPIYPLLALMAAWLLIWLWDWGRQKDPDRKLIKTRRLAEIASLGIGLGVLTATALWAISFSGIYVRDETRIAASKWIYQNVPGPITLNIQLLGDETVHQPLPFPQGNAIQPGAPYDTFFVAQADGFLSDILLPHITDPAASGLQTFSLSVSSGPQPVSAEQVLATTSITADFGSGDPVQGEPFLLKFDDPLLLTKSQTYYLHLETTGGTLLPGGSAVVNETDYDYGLPFRIGGYDGFGGLYRGDLNLQVYWEDNADKLTRFITTLKAADYIFIPTNHQYGQITRLIERYPLTTAYYRLLLGCPDGKEIIWCYRTAEPGTFEGKLGFDLAAVFTSYPSLGNFEINDQSAEEAFTFYDHPKVMIFKKSANYDAAKMEALLTAVDFSNAVHLTPGQADNYKDLMLPAEQLATQQAGGTWSELFDPQIFYNRNPFIGLVIWYLFIFFLGLLAYPIVRLALPGLSDRGYPLARTVGLLLWAWLAWMAGSLGLTYSRGMIALMLGLLVVMGVALAIYQRKELKTEIQTRWRYFLMVEGIFLLFFLLDLGIRLGNPDLWHPYKGGERPMDFSYLNAVLKSTSFPPYDPWFAGGYINYYYFGYVLVGTPVKLLGIVPTIAYNFILPTLFAMVAVNAFSVGWNIMDTGVKTDNGNWKRIFNRLPFMAGFSSAAAMLLLGNLGIIRMLYQGFQRIVAPDGVIESKIIFQNWWWAIQGFFKTLSGTPLPFITGDWYWLPSRVIPAPGDVEPITEFPLFTFLYSDLHAHMIVLPLTLLVIAWALSVLVSRARWNGKLDSLIGIGLGGLVIGSLKPTNTWDYYTYLVLGMLAIGYGVWKSAFLQDRIRGIPQTVWRAVLVVSAMLAVVTLSIVFFQPYSKWLSQAYGSVDYWKYGHTPIGSYLTQWGVFLFFIVSWMTWETRQWMAETPLSALNKLRPYRKWIESLLVNLAAFILVLLITKVAIAWLVLPMGVWAALLILKRDMPDVKRGVLFLVGTGLVLALVVEIIVLRGDIGRMNTVFKFYLQAWVLFGLSAAAAFGWLLTEIPKWRLNWQSAWYFMATGLILCASLFLILGGMDKIKDRWIPDAPRSLDSMTFMKYATYQDFGVDMDLSQDYRAIQWMQANVVGSPVIVEANVPEYRWGSRFTIYTGLPGVVGWNWHQRQQRVMASNIVFQRVDEITTFYKTSDPLQAMDFLKKYNVRYIIVGQLERAEYRDVENIDAGILKFDKYNGTLWQDVYRDDQTVIYSVIGG
jgi:YYY domain-containing protein